MELGTSVNDNVKYQPITVKVEAPIGITTVGNQDFSVKIDPVFTGEITSVSMKSHGRDYGTPDILNYKRQPDFSLINGSGAQLTPIVSSFGELIGVIVNNGGDDARVPWREKRGDSGRAWMYLNLMDRDSELHFDTFYNLPNITFQLKTNYDNPGHYSNLFFDLLNIPDLIRLVLKLEFRL